MDASKLKGQAAKDAGIPLLTWDTDLLPENKDLRVAYIGTHNYEIGTNLAKLVKSVKPNGGTICIQSGGAAAASGTATTPPCVVSPRSVALFSARSLSDASSSAARSR